MPHSFVASAVLAAVCLFASATAVQAQAAETTLDPYRGAWTVAISGTPLGTISGTLTVAPDSSGTLSLDEMQVEGATLQEIHASGDEFGTTASFFSPVSGQFHEVTISLAPQNDGTLAGTATENGSRYAMEARRPAP